MIRTATDADRPALVALDQIAWDASSTPADLPLKGDWAGEVELSDLLVADEDGALAGYVLIGKFAPRLTSADHAGVIRGIAVHPDHRGKGIGRRLLAATLDEARRRGWTTVVLNALASNTAALALYRSMGFRAVGKVRGLFHLQGARVDDYQLQIELTEPVDPEWLEGGCHCGDVRFRVRVRDWDVLDCNCSMCTKKGILHLIVGPEDFELLTPDAALSTYTFNTHVAQHHFCPRCGIHPFYRPRSHPEGWDVNARCLDGDALERCRILPFDGRNWESNVARIR